MTHRLLSILLLWLAASGAATPALARDSEAAFTRQMAERFRQAFPDQPVEVEGPMQIRVGEGDQAAHANVERVFRFCATATAGECEDLKARFVTTLAEALAGVESDGEPVARERLRVAIRHSDFCDYLALSPDAASADGERAMTRPVAKELCRVLMVDYPTYMRTLLPGDLAGLGLDADAGWALAERQTLAELPEPDRLEGLADSLVVVTDFDYAISLVLNSEGWRRAAAAGGGEILAAIPSDRAMIILRRTADTDIEAFRRLVREDHDTAERGISTLVYRWTDAGWAPLD